MSVCSAFACKNSYRKGFAMKRFPRNPERRKLWAENMKIADFKPTDNSYLCEVHFSPEMWEKTLETGLRKLKRDAVPTIFPEPVNQRRKSKQEQLVAADHVAVQLEDNKVLLIPSTSTILVVEPEDKPNFAEKKTAFVPIAPKIEEEKTTTETSSVPSEDEVLPSKPAEDAMDVEEKSIKTQTSTAPSEDEVSPLPSPSLEITVEVDEDGKTQSITVLGPSDVEMSPCPSTRVEDKAKVDEEGDSSASLTANESRGSRNTDWENVERGNNPDEVTLLDPEENQVEEEGANVDAEYDRARFRSIKNPPKRARKTPAQQAVDCMKSLSEIVTRRDDYSVFGEYVANTLRNCNRPKAEVSLAQHRINDALFKLDMGLLAAEIQSIQRAHMASTFTPIPSPSSYLPHDSYYSSTATPSACDIEGVKEQQQWESRDENTSDVKPFVQKYNNI